MAHHLAELITTAQTGEGEAKQQAEDRAAELILKLWTNRRALPVPADPLHGHLAAIKVLSAMDPTANPWRRFQRGGGDDALLGDMFDALAHLVMSGLMLTRSEEMRQIEDPEWDALSDEEKYLVEILDRWRDFVATPAPETISLESFYLKFVEGNGDSDAEGMAADADPQEPATEAALDPERKQRAAILAHLETFQARLADLIEGWHAAGGVDRPAHDPEGSE
jgi:hypothetical protein